MKLSLWKERTDRRALAQKVFESVPCPDSLKMLLGRRKFDHHLPRENAKGATESREDSFPS